MRKLARALAPLLALAVLSTSAIALAQAPRRFSKAVAISGTATDSAPSSAPTSTTALNLFGVTSFRITVCADSGQTLSGGGTVDIWLYNPTISLWTWNEDLTQDIGTGGTRCQVFPDLDAGRLMTGASGFYLFPRINGATASGGTNITTRIDACTRFGCAEGGS